ncbi:MAG: alpha-2-macroglobulin family protein [Candidatus Taylorbacteria bacterium]
MNRKRLIFVALALVIVVGGFFYLRSSPIFHPPQNYEAAYRLVPEKVSRSAAIMVQIPNATTTDFASLSQSVSFDPAIKGEWLKERNGSFVPVANAAEKIQTLYFQPARALDTNKHYAVAVNIGGQILRSDFFVVADPEVLAILPAGDDEVLPNTKISVVFNRPMVPLGRLDQFVSDTPPISVKPATPGRFKWISTNTLQFIPTDALISSAHYTVSVGSGLVSMEGIPVKPRDSTFSTYHLGYYSGAQDYQASAVRGYNQPFLIRFNQPVDLAKTAQEISISDGEKRIPFTAKFGQVLSTDAKQGASREDETTIALYPAGARNWEPGRNYQVAINKAYPASGGDIALTESQTFSYSVDDIIKEIQVSSPRTFESSVARFDPTGTLILNFYEDIDLGKSQIQGAQVANVVYGEKCQTDALECVKVADQSQVIVSFKSNSSKPGDKIQVALNNITSRSGALLSRAEHIDLTVFPPLVIFKVGSKDSLGSVSVCSNNPLAKPADDKPAIESTPEVSDQGWGGSYFLSNQASSDCAVGQFQTSLSGALLPSQIYNLKTHFVDVFGGVADGAYSFTSRAIRAEDYDLQSFQDFEAVTTPEKTKLTYAAKYLREVTATVCKLSALSYFQAQNASRDAALPSCEQSVSKTIPLPTETSGKVSFTLDIKDFYPNPVGNFVVSLDSPLLKKSDSEGERFPTRNFVSVTNLIVTEKSITPLAQNEYESLTLRGDQLGSLQNMYWVIDAGTRIPIAGATVNLYRKGAVVGSAVTNTEGVAFLTPVIGADVAIAFYGADSSIISGDNNRLNYAQSAANIKHLYLYTDKPLYRPGQEINLKGYYRLGYDGFYEAPVGQSLTLNVYDSADTIIKTENLTTKGFGSINTSFVLDPSVALGSYRACVANQCSYFEVLNYAPAAFKVTMKTKSDELLMGEQPEVNIKAEYYFGVPLSVASVKYRTLSQYYYFDKYTKEYFNFNNLSDDVNGDSFYYGDKYIGSGTATLDDEGVATLKPDLKSISSEGNATSKIIIVDATVENQQGHSIGSQASFVLHAAPVYLGSKIDESFVASGAPVTLKLKSVKSNGEVTSFGKIKVDVYRVNWVSTKRDRGLGEFDYSWERMRELVKTEYPSTDGNGDASLNLTITGEGEYEAEVRASSGRAVGSRSWFYLYGGGNVSVRGNDDETSLELVTDKEDLKLGDTGEILIKMPEGSAKALVTIERGKIFEYQVIDIVGSLTRYQFPVVGNYYPNVYVSVVAYAPGRTVRFGSQSFTVASGQKKINLSIESDKKSYNPGDPVTLALNATDESGRGVVAETSLAVVDMSVLALRGNPKKDPLSEFYGHVPLTVQTYSNFKNLLKQIKLDEGGKGGSGSGSSSTGEKRRGVFKEVAFWKSNIVTDNAGHAVVKFTLPDNLTTWQGEAVAMTGDSKVGVAYNEFTTNKLLMVDQLRPRFVVVGDQFSLGATIFNQSEKDFSGTVSVSAPALTLMPGSVASKSLSLKAGASMTLYWPMKLPSDSSITKINYSINANGSGLSDIVDDSFPVHSDSSYEVTATAGQTETSQTEVIYVPDSVRAGVGGVTMRSSATLAIFLPEAVKFLVDYPYGCTEQIASRIRGVALYKQAIALPNVTSAKAPTITYNDREYSLDELVNEGLKSIYARQNSDGGFDLWAGDRQSSYSATLEAVNTFSTLSSAGYSVNADAWSKAATYLYTYYRDPKNVARFDSGDIVALAEALFTRAEFRNNVGISQDLSREIEQSLKDKKIDSGRLLNMGLLLRRYQLFPSFASQIDKMLANRLVIDSRGAFLDGSGNYFGFANDNAVSNTARYISLLTLERDKGVELPNLLRWLTASRERDGAWGSTQYTLDAITAITNYLNWQEETKSTFTLERRVNDKVIDQFAFTPETIMTQVTKFLPLSEFNFGGLNTVSFGKSSASANNKGNIYYDLAFKYYLPAGTLPPRDEGIAVKRNFYTLSDTASEKPVSNAAIGEVVREHLEITVPVTRRQVVLEDFIPAGTEIVDTSLATEDQTLKDVSQEVKNPRLMPNHQELRDDRAALFMDELSPGTYEFDYFVRALIPGTYLQLPAQVSEMYNPENFGRTGASLFTIQ